MSSLDADSLSANSTVKAYACPLTSWTGDAKGQAITSKPTLLPSWKLEGTDLMDSFLTQIRYTTTTTTKLLQETRRKEEGRKKWDLEIKTRNEKKNKAMESKPDVEPAPQNYQWRNPKVARPAQIEQSRPDCHTA